MYVQPNFKTKKALQDAVAAGQTVTVYNPDVGDAPPYEGEVDVEGPWFPKPHMWYGTVKLVDGRVKEVR